MKHILPSGTPDSSPSTTSVPTERIDNRFSLWTSPAIIAPNNFVYKSLSNWAFNIAVGCSHACRCCYVPSAATIRQGPQLAHYGVSDPHHGYALAENVHQVGRSCTGLRVELLHQLFKNRSA